MGAKGAGLIENMWLIIVCFLNLFLFCFSGTLFFPLLSGSLSITCTILTRSYLLLI